MSKVLLILSIITAAVRIHAADPVWSDAIALWHFADDRDSAQSHHLKMHGAVKLGVAGDAADTAASKQRGGDGKVAVFEGGHLEIDPGAGVLNLPGQSFTIALRVRDPEGKWNGALFGSYGGKEQVSYFLHAVDGAKLPMLDLHGKDKPVPTVAKWLYGTPGGPKAVPGSQSFLEFIWGADTPNAARVQKLAKATRKDFPLYEDVTHGLMHVGFPAQSMGLTDWHDVVIRFTGPKLQLFIDGVIMDEEFPIGSTRQNQVPCLIGAAMENGKLMEGFRGQMDHAAVWTRALSDDEIARLSGGAEHVAQRDAELLGPLSSQIQYFRPRGYNAKAGDCMPFWHDGTFHLYYLVLRRNRHSKWDWGHGALEFHHASTRDLVTWEHHPVAVPISEQWNAWNGTGAFVFHEGQFHLFHPCPSYDKQWPFTGIQHVTSRDGIHFTKQEPHPFMEGGDCEIYREEATGLFHLLKAGDAPKGRKKLVRLVSPDLREWKEAPEPFMDVEEKYGVRTCPHLFGWKGSFYFMGGNTLWTSSKQFGPWTQHAPLRLEQLSVPKTAPFGSSDRRLLAGFLIDGDWGGNLIVRELVQNADRSLGSKFVPEMMPAAGEPLKFSIQTSDSGSLTKTTEPITLAVKGKEPASAFVVKVPQNARISLDIEPGSAASLFGISLRGRAALKDSCQLVFDPARQLVNWRTMTDSASRRTAGPRAENMDLSPSRLHLEIICRHDLVDVEINGCRTLANRYWDVRGDRLYLWSEKGSATFSNLQIRPLTEQP